MKKVPKAKKLLSHQVYWKPVVLSLCFLWGSFCHKRCLSSKNPHQTAAQALLHVGYSCYVLVSSSIFLQKPVPCFC